MFIMCLGLACAAVSAQQAGLQSSGDSLPAPTSLVETRADYNDGVNPFIAHAPLAIFSAGSLAVGAVFYSIQQSMRNDQSLIVAGNRSQMNTAIAAAGATALISAMTYFYYAHRDSKRAAQWSESAAASRLGPAVSGGLAPDGTLRVAASWSLPLPSRP
jgi:hypothetical protein